MTYNVVNWQLIAGVSVAVTATVQILKTRKPFNRFDGELLAAGTGIVIALYYCAMAAGAQHDWHDWVRCGVSGLVAGVAASGAYNLQKGLPVPNLLPTRTEKAASTQPPDQPQP